MTGQELRGFLATYRTIAGSDTPALKQFLALVEEQRHHPYTFPPYHEAERQPIDRYQVGVDLIRPLIDFSRSKLEGAAVIQQIEQELAAGHNVILFSNHQSEVDPQIISLLLGPAHAALAERMIFVAGHRVVTDPLAVPLSRGRNLLCIHSRKYIDHPPEEKEAKVRHNQHALHILGDLLHAGGVCLFIAPSGGRDRMNEKGEIEVAPFDPDSIEMCALLARRAGTPTSFYPMALATYALLPPPRGVRVAIGESREVTYTPCGLHLGPAVDMEQLATGATKQARRTGRANALWQQTACLYKDLLI